jgi:histidinol-phosphate/aromatic aminotransferase/cobyric acid decarboxylase-like protein
MEPFDGEPVRHGGLQEAELRALGLSPDAVLDFSSSTNPYGPDPAVLRALASTRIDRYPDPTALRAREALGERCGVDASQIVLGNGAAELLWSLARCLLAPGESALIAEPTFSEFRSAASCIGARVLEWRSRPEHGFAIDLAALSARALETAAAAAPEQPRAVYLCSPNTPTGSALPALAIGAWASEWATRAPAACIVLDQSFLSLSERWQDAEVALPGNVVAVRSLTKDHGIPGVRLGYLIGPAALCRRLEASRPAWSTSALAQAAAIACCNSGPFVRESRERLLDDRRQLAADLGALGIESVPSQANFLLARVPQVAALRARLLARHQILVRDCASFGLPGFLRLGARPEADRARLLAALRAESL